MTGITVKELLEATGGNLLHGQEDQHAKHISLDSRKMEGDDLFVPIVGERVDAHRFLCQAIASGAAVVFTSEHHCGEEVKACVRQQCGENREQERKALQAAWIEVPFPNPPPSTPAWWRRTLSVRRRNSPPLR